MKEFWNERFGMQEYVYGTTPNEYLKEVLAGIKPGKILFPAEGEGRNAVYAAQLGFEVDAFDYSEAGRQKALALAELKAVSINYQIQDFDTWEPIPETYDVIALIYAHPPVGKRELYHSKVLKALKSGGIIILEGFNKSQLGNKSGGPQVHEMLYSVDELKSDFQSLQDLEIYELQTELSEGDFHKGIAEVIRMIGFTVLGS